jgi:methionine aminopeptidase
MDATLHSAHLDSTDSASCVQGLTKMRAACKLAAEVLEFAGTLVQPGVTTDAIDQAVHDMIVSRGAYPSPLNYGKFPKSVCTSVNECVCHGIPDDRPLQKGDIINIDVTVYLDGHHGDTSRMFYVGEVSPKARALCDATKEALDAAIKVWTGVDVVEMPHVMSEERMYCKAKQQSKVAGAAHDMQPRHSHGCVLPCFVAQTAAQTAAVWCVPSPCLHRFQAPAAGSHHLSPAGVALLPALQICGPGVPVKEIGNVISEVAKKHKLTICKDFIGHGVGRVFHAAPQVLHHRNNERGTMQVSSAGTGCCGVSRCFPCQQHFKVFQSPACTIEATTAMPSAPRITASSTAHVPECTHWLLLLWCKTCADAGAAAKPVCGVAPIAPTRPDR